MDALNISSASSTYGWNPGRQEIRKTQTEPW